MRLLLNILLAVTLIGVAEREAKDGALSALEHGYVSIPPATHVFTAASTAARVEMTNTALRWVKGYVESAEFKAAYARLRNEHKPPSVAEEEKANRDELLRAREDAKAQLEQAKKTIQSLPPEQRKQAEEALKIAAAQLAEQSKRQDTPQEMSEDEKQANADKIKEWETDYPADPRVLVARRLKQFLAVSGSVDFSAKLTPQRTFVNPDYEGRPREWKLCYRAGKESVTAARQFASAWLKEIESR